MVKFNELRITPNGQTMVIDASVLNLDYYTNVYIDEILIDNQDTYINSGPSEKAISVYKASDNIKDVRVELDKSNFTYHLTDNLFFVYIKTKGSPTANTPCGLDNVYTLGTVMYLCSLYTHMMSYIKELNNSSNCSIPKDFINEFLRFKALEFSISSGHYTEAINFYNKFIKNLNSNTTIKTCNCHG